MSNKFSRIDRIIFLSVSFTLVLVIARFIYTREFEYMFYGWNLFLALIPFVCSKRLRLNDRFSIKAAFLLGVWLLFFPNAPYLVTDLLHFTEREGCPLWFDVILVSSASWNGIIIAIVSLLNVEQFLKACFHKRMVNVVLLFFIILCGYGVYLGRFLRFNSWDIISNPGGLVVYIIKSFIHPHQNFGTWAFTIVFSSFFGIIFFTVKELREG